MNRNWHAWLSPSFSVTHKMAASGGLGHGAGAQAGFIPCHNLPGDPDLYQGASLTPAWFGLEQGIPVLANKNTGCSLIFKCQIYNEHFCSISTLHAIFRTYLPMQLFVVYLKIPCNWTPCIFPGKSSWSLSNCWGLEGNQPWGV